MMGTVLAGGQSFFVFNAPNEPGVFDFFGPNRFHGMTGIMRVGPACPVAATPCIASAAVAHAADLRSGAMAPGEIVTIFGRGIGPESGVMISQTSGTLPTTLGDTQVFFDGIAAPLIFAQANQVNAIVPFEMASRQGAQVEIVHAGRRTNPITVSMTPFQPGTFTMSGSGSGQAIAMNQNGTMNSGNTPAAAGSIVSLFVTGTGQTDPPGVNGGFATDDLTKPIGRVEVLVGGMGAQVLSARVPRGAFAGIVQVDIRLPANAPTGSSVPVGISIADVVAPSSATIAIQ